MMFYSLACRNAHSVSRALGSKASLHIKQGFTCMLSKGNLDGSSPEALHPLRLRVIRGQRKSPRPVMVVSQAERTMQMPKKSEKMANSGLNCWSDFTAQRSCTSVVALDTRFICETTQLRLGKHKVALSLMRLILEIIFKSLIRTVFFFF